MRYFLIDRVIEFQKGESAAGIKNITLTDEILQDHFPTYPVFPGVLMIEAMAQLGGFLVESSRNRPDTIRRAVLAQVDKAKFHQPAEPGDQLIVRVSMAEQMSDAARVNAKIEVLGEKIATAKITFVLREIESSAIHEQRRELYRLWTRHLSPVPEIL